MRFKKGNIYVVSYKVEDTAESSPAKFLEVRGNKYWFFWYDNYNTAFLFKKQILKVREPTMEELGELMIDEI